MSRKSMTQDELATALTAPGPALNTRPVDRLSAPVTEMGMSVTLDQVRPYDGDPRSSRNPKYDEIKASIRAAGLKHPPSITQRPGDDKYMISDGGNTRLKILQELWEETSEERFYRIWCVYRPWQSEAHALAGHLSENETRGDLSWIEKSLGVHRLKEQLEADSGDTLSQRELARRAQELGYSIDHSHISRMLYTVDHLWPTLPRTLESGLGQGQIKRLISYREACQLIWARADAKPIDDFGQAWHEVMAQFDADEQTELPWKIVEDRLLGMLEDETGAHFNAVDYSLRAVLDYRQRRWKLEDHEEDVWGPLDAEMQRVLDPDNAPPLEFYPPKPDKPSALPSSQNSEHAPAKEKPTPQQSPKGAAPQSSAEPEVDELRAQVETLERQLAQQQTSTLAAAPTPSPSPIHDQGEGDTGEDTDSYLNDEDGETNGTSGNGLEDELASLLDDRREALTLSPVREAEGHRRLREMMALEHGEEPNDVEANMLRAIPIMSDGPMHTVTDIWYVEPHYRGARELRVEIGQFAQALARWAGFNMPGDDHLPVRVEYTSGMGYSLEPLTNEQTTSLRAQRVWQLLAGLLGDANPAYVADLSVMGALLGTSDADDAAMPDEVLVRYFRLVRLMRMLREQLANAHQEGATS